MFEWFFIFWGVGAGVAIIAVLAAALVWIGAEVAAVGCELLKLPLSAALGFQDAWREVKASRRNGEARR